MWDRLLAAVVREAFARGQQFDPPGGALTGEERARSRLPSEPRLLGYNAGEDGCGLAHLAEVILCEICGLSSSHSVPNGLMARGS